MFKRELLGSSICYASDFSSGHGLRVLGLNPIMDFPLSGILVAFLSLPTSPQKINTIFLKDVQED